MLIHAVKLSAVAEATLREVKLKFENNLHVTRHGQKLFKSSFRLSDCAKDLLNIKSSTYKGATDAAFFKLTFDDV